MKNKTTVVEQIEKLKARNVRFNIISEDNAKEFLNKKTYYFKIAAYRENFDYNRLQNGSILYKDLDFAYLKELSKIDTYIRYIILEFTLDIEHFLKRLLVEDMTNDINDNGHDIVNLFINNNEYASKHLQEHKKSPYSFDLINKYNDDMPLWVFVEVSTFGDFLYFYNYYYNYKKIKPPIDNKILNQIKSLRNACAHNNCIINNIGKQIPNTSNLNAKVKQWCYILLPNINPTWIDNMLRKQVIYDFISMLYVYCNLADDKQKDKKIYRLYLLFKKRVCKHSKYFAKNQRLKSAYNFVFKIIVVIKDKYCKHKINNFMKNLFYI